MSTFVSPLSRPLCTELSCCVCRELSSVDSTNAAAAAAANDDSSTSRCGGPSLPLTTDDNNETNNVDNRADKQRSTGDKTGDDNDDKTVTAAAAAAAADDDDDDDDEDEDDEDEDDDDVLSVVFAVDDGEHRRGIVSDVKQSDTERSLDTSLHLQAHTHSQLLLFIFIINPLKCSGVRWLHFKVFSDI